MYTLRSLARSFLSLASSRARGSTRPAPLPVATPSCSSSSVLRSMAFFMASPVESSWSWSLSSVRRFASSCSGSDPMFCSLNFLRAASWFSRTALAFFISFSRNSMVPSAYCSFILRFSSMKSDASLLVTCIVLKGSRPV